MLPAAIKEIINMASGRIEANNPNAFFTWLRSSQARWMTIPITIFLFTRLIVAIGAYVPASLGIQLIPPTVEVIEDESLGPLKIWARWDAVWYPTIADTGYQYVPGSDQYAESTVAFFPLYPLLIALFKPVTGSALAAGILISNVAFLIALMLLYRLTTDIANIHVAKRTIFYLAAFPSSFFFSTAYTESLFLLLVLGATCLVRSRRWAAAALLGALATATRKPGILIIVIAGLEWLQSLGDMRFSGEWLTRHNLTTFLRRNWQPMLAIALIPTGLIVYILYLQLTFDAPMAWVQASSAWGKTVTNPITAIITDISRVLRGETLGGHALVFIDALNIVLVFAVLFMLPAIKRRIGGTYALYCFLSVILPIFGRTEGMNRYVLVMFPVFIVLGIWGKRRWVDLTLTIVFLPLLAIFSALFTNWIFVG